MNKKLQNLSHISVGIFVLILSACASSNHGAGLSGPEKSFSSPEQATNALVEADRQNNKGELLAILGPDGAKIISSGDPVADKEGRERFVEAYDKAHRLEGDGDNKKILVVGEEEWPLPIPLIRASDKEWRFDTKEGSEEILNRRIGRNELMVIEICRSYVEGQHEYADMQQERKSEKADYAQHFISTKGKHDGLYWPVQAGEQESPFGPLIANARAEGYSDPKGSKHEPYHGYYYKILKQQGSHARDGAKNYIVHGHMTEGFALIAFPAKYGDSGIMTFIVNQNGIVYEKNLGPDTAKLAKHIAQYDPDQSWSVAH